jgi:hypothetical protein
MRAHIAVTVLVLTACDGTPGSDSNFHVVRSDSLARNGVWEIESTPVLQVRGDSGPVTDLYQVSSATRLADGSIVVADGAARLLVFDSLGTNAKVLGRRGSGPGEFQAVAWVRAFGDDSLLVFDPRLMRASVFTVDGFVRAFVPTVGSARASALGTFAGRKILAGTRSGSDGFPAGAGLVRPSLVLTRHDREGTFVDSVGVAPGDEIAIVGGVIVRPSFVRRTRIAVGRGHYHVASSDSFAILTHAADGTPRRLIHKAHPVTPVSAAVLAAELPAGVTLPTPPAYPAMGELLLDEAGLLWAQEGPTDRPAAQTWYVFGEAGRWLATVTMPERFRPLHIGRDAALGVWRDSLDVEHLRIHRLRRSG